MALGDQRRADHRHGDLQRPRETADVRVVLRDDVRPCADREDGDDLAAARRRGLQRALPEAEAGGCYRCPARGGPAAQAEGPGAVTAGIAAATVRVAAAAHGDRGAAARRGGAGQCRRAFAEHDGRRGAARGGEPAFRRVRHRGGRARSGRRADDHAVRHRHQHVHRCAGAEAWRRVGRSVGSAALRLARRPERRAERRAVQYEPGAGSDGRCGCVGG